MKILIISQYYYPEPFRITDIAETLVNQGHEVTVLTGLPNYPEGKILKEYRHHQHKDEIRNGVHIIRVYEHGRGHNAIHLIWNYFSYALSAQHYIHKLDHNFDVVFINQLSPVMAAWPGIKYAKKYHKKTFLYCYDLWPESLSAGGIKKGSLIYSIFKRISFKIYQNVDQIAVTSKSFIDYFKNEHHIKEDKLVYLPQYCEDLFTSIKDSEHQGLNFVFAGNVGRVQSVETIIKAAQLIQDKDIKIHIVGNGSNLQNCAKLAKNLNNVIFYGKRSMNEMPKFYGMADAMLLTLSKNNVISYTLPGKVQSYMAAGKPIIASIDGEASQIINEAQCGLVCPAEDDKELAKLMIEFKNKDIKQMSDNSKKYYQEHFTKELFFNHLLQSLENLKK